MRLLILIPLLFVTVSLYAQQVVQDLDRYFASVRTDASAPLDERIFKDLAHHPQLIKLMAKYMKDENDQVSFRAIDLTSRIGSASVKKDVRSAAAHQLTMAISGNNPRRSGLAIRKITAFRREDFSPADQDSLISYVNPQMANLDVLIQMLGYIGGEKMVERLRSFSIQPASRKVKFMTKLALARTGDEDAIANVLDRINGQSHDNGFVSVIAPDLVYTRQKKLFGELVKLIATNEKQCRSANADRAEPVHCAYPLIELMSPCIADFPFTPESLAKNEDTEVVRMKVVTWFHEHPDYKITNDKF